MSTNKLTVQKYMDGFNKSDHAQILSCLADDIEWLMPGAFHFVGKEAFDKEIENDAFVGSPTIKITRVTEENDVIFIVVLPTKASFSISLSKASFPTK